MMNPRTQNEQSADPAAMLPIIQRCTHCGEITTKDAKYCKDCRTAEARRDTCNANKITLPSYVCIDCKVI